MSYVYEDDDGTDDDEGLEPPPCPRCGGPGEFLGQLGRLVWLRCRDCGTDFADRKEAS